MRTRAVLAAAGWADGVPVTFGAEGEIDPTLPGAAVLEPGNGEIDPVGLFKPVTPGDTPTLGSE